MTNIRISTETHQELLQLKENMQCKSIDAVIKQLINDNKQMRKQQEENIQFLIKSAKRLGFPSLDHLLYTLDKGEITGYSTANWENGGLKE